MRTAIISLLSSIAVAVMVLAMPASALAASVPFYYGGIGGGEPLLPCTGFAQINLQESKPDPNDPKLTTTTYTSYQAVSGTATNGLRQCQSLCDVFLLINNLLRLVISVLITIFAPIMFLIGGFYIMTSGGNPGNRATGIKIFTGTLIGIAISLCAALIVGQLMTLVFDEQWGDTLKQKLTDQATQAGVDSTKIPNFTWNTLTCIVTDGAVEIGTGDTTKNPYYLAPSKDPVSSSATGCSKAGGTCVTTEGKKSCGGTISSDSCTTEYPHCCIGAKDNACVKTCKDAGGIWRGVITQGKCQCNTESDTKPVSTTQNECEKMRNSCQTDATCKKNGIAVGALGKLGCSADTRCCNVVTLIPR